MFLTYAHLIGLSKHTCDCCGQSTDIHSDIMQSVAWTIPLHLRCIWPFPQLIRPQDYAMVLITCGFPTACSNCGHDAPIQTVLCEAPQLIVLNVTSNAHIMINLQVVLHVEEKHYSWQLYSIVYNGANHYSDHYVDLIERVWLHNGQQHSGNAVLKTISGQDTNLHCLREMLATHVIYCVLLTD